MAMLVMKFGGTSVGDEQAINRAAEIVLDQSQKWDQLVVVLSAMSSVTDALTRGALTAAAGDEDSYQEIFDELKSRHHRVVLGLLPNGEKRSELLKTVDEILREFSVLCHSVFVLGEITDRALDTITSIGERVSVRIFAALVQHLGRPSQAIEASDLIVTDDKFQNAAPLMELTRHKAAEQLNRLLDSGVIAIVTGFIGATQSGVITTLGRGGSDFTAAILSECLDADEAWIWTDVDGVMTADPRLVPNARPIPMLSYAEVSELAYFGAKVLHPKTIRPIIEHGTPLWVKNTFNPAWGGTQIARDPDTPNGEVKAVTAIPELSMVTVEGRGMLGVPGIAARTFAAVASQRVSVLMISQASSEQSICFVIPTPTVSDVTQAIEAEIASELERRDIDRVWSLDEVVIVTAVGAGLRTTPGIAARIFGSLGRANINVIAIAQGSSECSLSLVVSASDAARAVFVIHEEVIIHD